MKQFYFRGLLFCILYLLNYTGQAQSASKLFKEGQKATAAKNYTLAIDKYSQALVLKPGVYKVLMARAKAFELSTKLNEAAADYKQASGLKPKNIQLYLTLAKVYMRLGRYEEALGPLKTLTHLDEWNREGLENLAWCLIMTKTYTEAIGICDLVLNGDKHHYIKQDNVINYYKGVAKDSLKDYNSAVLSYIKAISLIPAGEGKKISPVYKPYYTNLATAQYHISQLDESIKNYSTASSIDLLDTVVPKNYRIYYLRSFAYVAKADFTNAIGDLNKALVLNPKDKSLFVQRASVYQKTSNYQSAISDYTKAILLDPQDENSFRERAVCHLELAKFSEAILDLKKALLLDDRDTQAKSLLDQAEKKNFDANRESDPPELKMEYPLTDNNNFINIYENQLDVIVTGQARDKSQLKFIKVNDVKAEIKTEDRISYFKCKIPVQGDFRKIDIVAQDIYGNQSVISVKVGKIVDDSRIRVTFKGKLLADNEAKSPLANRTLYMCNDKGEAFYATKTDGTGFFKFDNLPYDKNYMLTLDVGDSPLAAIPKFFIANENNKPILEGKLVGKAKFRFDILQADYHAMSLMSMEDEPLKIDLKGKLLAGNDARSPLANVNIQLLNEKSEVVSTHKTDAYGFFQFSGILPEMNYSIRVDAEETKNFPYDKIILTDEKGKIIKQIAKGVYGFFTYDFLVTEKTMLTTITEPDPWLKTMKLNKDNTQLVIIENLYYESGAFQIRPEFEVILNKAVDALKNNPRLTLEVQSHTDAVAGDDYNMELSQKRAGAVADYLVSKGIDKKRITPKGYGETQLINRCANGVDCSDAEHKQNRRTVFKINFAAK
jgi:outer membrane protein OmpA-like peptidoglycan-associated protein/tetratricopeptide (TPR) repeat protein